MPHKNPCKVKSWALSAAVLLSSASGIQLQIYPNFSEVRQNVEADQTTLSVSWPETAWANLIPGTLNLRGLPFVQATQHSEKSWLAQQEGQEVRLQTGDKVEMVTLVRASDLTVRDAQGYNRQVTLAQLGFKSLPPNDLQAPVHTLDFTLLQPGRGVLSYLTRAVSWSPRYTLSVIGDAVPELSALADLRNTTELPISASAAELYAGNVPLVITQLTPPETDFLQGRTTTVMTQVTTVGSSSPNIASLGELGGLYRYALKQPLSLPPRSTLTLPFLTPQLSGFQRFSSLQSSFEPRSRSGTLNRSYRFKADQRLPGGVLSVLEKGELVGQTVLAETAINAPVEFSLGSDPDLTYSRTVEPGAAQQPGSAGRAEYKVTYTVRNGKDQPVRVEIKEELYGNQVILGGVNRGRQATAQIQLDVPAGSSASQSLSVVLIQ